MSLIETATANYEIVFSYQGAFGPPTVGHYEAMKIFAQKMSEVYPGQKILMLFMPTKSGSLKPHLQPTQKSRINILDYFCSLLHNEFKANNNITFESSEIEYSTTSSSTIHTITKLHEFYPDREIILGMGLDNVMELPYWERVNEYSINGVQKIFVVPRELTEKETQRKVGNWFPCPEYAQDKDGKKKTTAYKSKDNENNYITILDTDNDNNTQIGDNPDRNLSRQELGSLIISMQDDENLSEKPFKIIECPGDVPPTSSSMLRHFIFTYIATKTNENHSENVEKLAELKTKIDTIMYGKKNASDDHFAEMIDEYSKINFTTLTIKESNPSGDVFINIYSADNNDKYEEEYKKAFNLQGGGAQDITQIKNKADEIFKDTITTDGFRIIINKLCGGKVERKIFPQYCDLIIGRYDTSMKNGHEKYANGFGEDTGNFAGVEFATDVRETEIPATAFNDLYKWTMMPVIRELEKKESPEKEGGIIVTFGVDLRDKSMKDQINNDLNLRTEIVRQLKIMAVRKFSAPNFDYCVELAKKNKEIISADIANIKDEQQLVGGKVFHKENIGDEDLIGWRSNTVMTGENEIIDQNEVNICLFTRPGDVFIEATGPWHKVTWLETSMMQCVYETVLRYNMKKENIPYHIWLGDALYRTALSIAATLESPMTGALFTGRRTGGFLFLVLQNYMYGMNFGGLTATHRKSCAGTSSCDSIRILQELRLRDHINPVMPAGTHAHELSMVISSLYPELDLKLPGTTQIIGHYLYYKTWVKPAGDSRTFPLPVLPDTIGTNVFLNAASHIRIAGEGKTFMEIMQGGKTMFRQDSGEMDMFIKKLNMNGMKVGGGISVMASEIEKFPDIEKAEQLGYTFFGAGGFYGDSAKAWTHPKAASSSMAVKAIRVLKSSLNYKINNSDFNKNFAKYQEILTLDCGSATTALPTGGGEDMSVFPIKTGDKSNEDVCLLSTKLAIDKNASAEIIAMKTLVAQSAQSKQKIIQDSPIYELDLETMTFKNNSTQGGKRRRKMTHKRLHKTRRKQKNRKTGTRKKRRSLRKTRQTRG